MNRDKEIIETEMERLVSMLSLLFTENFNLFFKIMASDEQNMWNIIEHFDEFQNIAENLKQGFIQVTKNLLKLKKEYFELEV